MNEEPSGSPRPWLPPRLVLLVDAESAGGSQAGTETAYSQGLAS